jgi:alpha-mannosidase
MAKPKIHLICNAHLDPVWQWQWEEGCSEALSTFRTAVTLLDEYPELIFNHNEAVLYEWVKEHDPFLFEEIREKVKLGRWFVSGGWYLQPDVNLPDTESIIRHILYGREFFKTNFGVKPVVAYNFDSFGHSGGLPQILKNAGYKMYVHMRPQQDDLKLPSDLYIWEGIDGTRIPAYRISVGLYHTEYGNMEERLKQGVELALEKNRDIAVFWGIGDHGGGATRDDLEIIRKFVISENRVDIIHSTTDKFYYSLEPYIQRAPVHKGDLQRVFTGCYTSLSRVKRDAVSNAALARKAEMMATAAWWSGAAEYPTEKLKKAWLQHLFNDFHDILPGTCIEPAEKDTLDIYGSSRQEFRNILLHSAYAFNKLKTYREAYLPVTVVNTNPALTHVPVEFECMFGYRPPWEGKWRLKMFDETSNEIQIQEEQPEALLPFHNWRRKISFNAKLSPVGTTIYFLEPERIDNDNPIDVPKTAFEKPGNDSGLIEKLAHTKNENILSSPLLRPVVVNDTGDSWGTGCWSFHDIAGYFEHDKEKYCTIEQGPVRQIEESVFHYGHSKIIYHTIRYAAFDALELHIRVHWNESRKALRLETGFNFTYPEILAEVPGGAIVRPADGQEHIQGRWLIISGTNDDSAIGIINNGQAGMEFHEGKLLLSVLRSAAYCHEQGFALTEKPYRKFMDQGVHDLKLLIISGTKLELLEKLSTYAEYLNSPPVAYSHLPVGSKNKIAFKQFGLNISPSNLRLLAVKKSENGNDLVVRIQETSGHQTTGSVKLKYPETDIEPFWKPYEIKTLVFNKDGIFDESDIIERFSW